MSEDLSTVDAAQLARWAYGRAENSFEADRAQRAAHELQRRAENGAHEQEAQEAAKFEPRSPAFHAAQIAGDANNAAADVSRVDVGPRVDAGPRVDD